jgi:transglutaminase-like putative cysteine protease
VKKLPVTAKAALELPFLRERVLAVGSLALLAPVPLFFANALELLVLLVYVLALLVLLARARAGAVPRLPNAVLNLAGLAYLPVVYLDVRYGSQTLLKTMLHLLLFTTVFKLAAIRRERDLSLALVLSGMLFVASVSTSFHVAIVLYVVLMAGVAWAVLVKWALWRDLAAVPEEWERDRAARALPGFGPLVSSVAAAMVLAIPLFLFLPRLKAPVVRGSEAGREITTGFSDTVDPDVFGALKSSDRVMLRITSEEPLDAGAVLRLRTLALTRFERGVWKKPERAGSVVSGARGGVILLGPRPGGGAAMTIDLTPIQTRALPIPLGGEGLRLSETTFRTPDRALVYMDAARNVSLGFEPETTVQYVVTTSPKPGKDLLPGAEAEGLAAPDSGVLRAFARDALAGVDPAADPEGAARALEDVFHRPPFRYELDLSSSRGPNALEDFLTARRAGHCQTYASAMALLLRSVGIPSRFVTGFLGGEIGAFGRYVLVRGNNVHAWVEAWCGPEKGWVTFDPTPAAGQPRLERVPLSARLRQVTDGVEFFYDRFVLSFGQSDQAEMLRRLREATGRASDVLRAAFGGAGGILDRITGGRAAAGAGAAAILTLLAALALRRFLSRARFGTRGLPPASAAYRRLQKALHRRGAPLTPSSAPAETLDAAAKFGPAAAAPAAAIVGAYVRESFGGFSASEEEKKDLGEKLERFRSALSSRPAAVRIP